MHLAEIDLKNFRNYLASHLDFIPSVNILVGANAQGKTNILEAISLLCLGRSFRTKKETELIYWDHDFFYIKGHFVDKNANHLIEIGVGENKKRIKLNGQLAKGFDYFGKVPLVIFSPDDLLLIKGGPQLRRDFVDLYLAQVFPNYRYVYLNYLKVLQQRNRFLKEKSFNLLEMEVWNEQLVERGIKVIKYRSAFIERIKPYIIKSHQQISSSKENLDLEYLCMNKYSSPNSDEDELSDLFKAELKRVYRAELERKVTLVGPQRDDLVLKLDKQADLRTFGSQGQQRTAALALKVGLVEVITEERGVSPLLLLDDVMSEFDDMRKQALLKILLYSTQTFITATSRRDFPGITNDSVYYTVENGKVNYGN